MKKMFFKLLYPFLWVFDLIRFTFRKDKCLYDYVYELGELGKRKTMVDSDQLDK
jgi:hypothetical protein